MKATTGKTVGGAPGVVNDGKDDGYREDTIVAAKQYRTSWLAVAARLVRIASEKLYLKWDFEDLYTYASRELELTRKQVDDFIGNYTFLQRFEPELAKKPSEAKVVPPREVVQVLAKAADRGALQDEDWEEVRSVVLDRDLAPERKVELMREKFPAPAPAKKTEKAAALAIVRAIKKASEEMAVNSLFPDELKVDAHKLAKAIEKLSEKLQAA